MRLFFVCFLALTGWAAAAPGATSSSDKDTSEGLQQQKQESENDTLAPAISDIARRKRGSAPTNLPYSNYRPNSGMHRYRYPLYRKRSYRPQPSYDYEDEVILPEVENEYLDYEEQQRAPSLFRERNLRQQQDRKKKDMLYDDDAGYFSDDYIPERQLFSNPYTMPLKKTDLAYNLANIDPYDLEGLNQVHSVGRKSPPRISSTEQFYDAIDAIRKKKAMFDDSMSPSDATERMESLLKLKDALSSAATSRYLHGQSDPMIRKKRDTSVPHSSVVVNPNTTVSNKDLASTVPARYKQAQSYSDRRKRAFNDYYKWERNALASEYEPQAKRGSSSDRDYDFLTREYFKSIARSVGQKKKRMAYAQFEANKRSSIDEFLENPSMLQYMQSKLKEAEQEVAEEAEKELGEGDTEDLLSNIVVRLDALERMREALSRLEELQNEEKAKPQRVAENELSAAAKKRFSSNAISSSKAASRKRSDLKRMKMSAVDARRIRRMRRGEDILNSIFLDNTREDCPVLDRILMNCVSVSEIAGDQDKAFQEPCIRHEVCYMCGSGLSVSGHECDAVLSSALEASCSGNLDCLSAAGDTFNLLSNADRYDDEGTCTHDPCVRKFLESR